MARRALRPDSTSAQRRAFSFLPHAQSPSRLPRKRISSIAPGIEVRNCWDRTVGFWLLDFCPSPSPWQLWDSRCSPRTRTVSVTYSWSRSSWEAARILSWHRPWTFAWACNRCDSQRACWIRREESRDPGSTTQHSDVGATMISREGGTRRTASCGVDETTIFTDLEGLSKVLEIRWMKQDENELHPGVHTRLRPSKVTVSGHGDRGNFVFGCPDR
jgi:hypothetical protein